MLLPDTRSLARANLVLPPRPDGRVLTTGRPRLLEASAVAELGRRAVDPDTAQPQAFVASRAPTGPPDGQGSARDACVEGAQCLCPLPDDADDVEQAFVDDLCRQASRLAHALAWTLALVTLAVVVGLMLR